MTEERAFTAKLDAMIEFAEDGIVSKTFLERGEGKWVLFCMEEGQSLSSHTASMPATIYVIRGKGRITLGGETEDYGPGSFIHMPKDLKHAVKAVEDFVFLLILFK